MDEAKKDIFNMKSNIKSDESNEKPKFAGTKKKRLKLEYLLIAALFAAVLIFAVIKPAIIGYSVFNDVKKSGFSTEDYSLNVEKLGEQIKETESSLATCSIEKEQLNQEMESAKEKLTELNNDIDSLNSDIEKKQKQVDSLKIANSDLEEQINSQEEEYDTLLKNAARSICCKEKVDNEDIDYYTILSGKIDCSEESGEKLDCW